MIVYADSSSLVKVYVDELGSQEVRQLLADASAVGTSVVAYAEIRAGLARKKASGEIDEQAYQRALVMFERRWLAITRIEMDEYLVRNAGNLAEEFILRGFDAIHLASATTFQDRIAERISFSSFDKRLTNAADKSGLSLA